MDNSSFNSGVQAKGAFNYRMLLAAAAVLLVILGGWSLLNRDSVVEGTLEEQFAWRLVDGEDGRTVVSLRIAGVPVPVGAYPGECENPPSLLPGQVTAIICRDGQSGTEIGVFDESGSLVLKQGTLDASTGRGANFEAIVSEQ